MIYIVEGKLNIKLYENHNVINGTIDDNEIGDNNIEGGDVCSTVSSPTSLFQVKSDETLLIKRINQEDAQDMRVMFEGAATFIKVDLYQK